MNRFEEYLDLITKEEELVSLCESYQIKYTLEFGENLMEVLQLKIEAILLKKKISLIQASLNRGESPDLNKLEELASHDILRYKEEMEVLKQNIDIAGKSQKVSSFRSTQVKSLFRAIAKYFHPDINTGIVFDDELLNIWNNILNAYHKGDFNELSKFDIKARLALRDRGIDIEVEIPLDLEERIEDMNNRINNILSTEPYLYKDILNDKDRIKSKHELLNNEKNEYNKYIEELNKIYYSLTGGLAS